jgi:predicted nucleic acid-binding protein
VSRWYVDTSAAMKLIVDEAESDAAASAIDAERPDLVACILLETELRRAVDRYAALTQEAVTGSSTASACTSFR